MTPASRFRRHRLVDERDLGVEARAAAGDHQAVKLWLRLLACSTQVEQVIRSRLHKRFGITLARFDCLAQLERVPEGLSMSALSRHMMVTGGNVTGLVQTLVADGWVERRPDPADGRSQIVALTARGRREFLAMAAEHEQWLQALFQGFEKTHASTLYEMLGRLRVHLVERTADEGAAARSRSAR